MATKPTDGPLWAPNGGAARVVYPSTLQDAAVLVSGVLPAAIGVVDQVHAWLA